MFEFSIFNIIICISILLFICILYFIVFVPHYDDKAKLVLFGKYYNTETLKLKEHENHIENLHNNYKELEDKYKYVYDQNEELINKNIELKESNDEYVKRVNLLTSKLSQQETYYNNQIKQNKEEFETELNKHSFSKVSKKEFNNDRPSVGNMFNKNLKTLN